MAQWTIDPRDVTNGKVSADVCTKALTVVDARVIVRLSRRMFRVPSWTQPYKTYNVVIVVPPKPEAWKATCQCNSTGWCHHGYAAALELARLDHLDIPVPGQPRSAGKRARSLTVIPGGRT